MRVRLEDIRGCFEGIIPATIATCDAAGTPNVTYISHVHQVDGEHVALSYQFFNKTRRNLEANPHATIALIDPRSGAPYRLKIEYLRTETDGPVFEDLRARLDATAALTGMADVFRLRGADICRVRECDSVGAGSAVREARAGPGLREVAEVVRRLSARDGLDSLVVGALDGLHDLFGYRHSTLGLVDESGDTLFTIASRGYDPSGVGSETPVGDGLAGTVAARGVPVRIGQLAGEARYGRAVRRRAGGPGGPAEREIPPPRLPDVQSVLAVPVAAGARILGVIAVESPEPMRFTEEDEMALRLVADHLGVCILLGRAEREGHDGPRVPAASPAPADAAGPPIRFRCYGCDDSVFADGEYLIKGVAGAILRRLLEEHAREGRTEFTNRELRIDPALGLPALRDNLEARLVLLRRRLEERSDAVRLRKTGRGRFRLELRRPVRLEVVSGS
jgi:predicted pyridoxine 5'-phosphate oxidase superfamily flavin-nucleotide-binding protein